MSTLRKRGPKAFIRKITYKKDISRVPFIGYVFYDLFIIYLMYLAFLMHLASLMNLVSCIFDVLHLFINHFVKRFPDCLHERFRI